MTLPSEPLTPAGIGAIGILIVAALKRLKAGKVGGPVGLFVREYTMLVRFVVTSLLSLIAWLLVHYSFDTAVQAIWAWVVAACAPNQAVYNAQKAAANRL